MICIYVSFSGCSGCAQPLCYIMDISLPTSGSNFTSVCCNYYMLDGITCTTACPPSSYPDGNRICGKNRSVFQHS